MAQTAVVTELMRHQNATIGANGWCPLYYQILAVHPPASYVGDAIPVGAEVYLPDDLHIATDVEHVIQLATAVQNSVPNREAPHGSASPQLRAAGNIRRPVTGA